MKHHPRSRQLRVGQTKKSDLFRLHSAPTSLVLRFILAPFGSAPPLYFRKPLRGPAPAFSLSDGQAFQHDDRFGNLIAFRPKVRQHFVDVHFPSVPESGVAVTKLFLCFFRSVTRLEPHAPATHVRRCGSGEFSGWEFAPGLQARAARLRTRSACDNECKEGSRQITETYKFGADRTLYAPLGWLFRAMAAGCAF